jgi:hypothetical protein
MNKLASIRALREAKVTGQEPHAQPAEEEVFVSKTYPWFEAPVPKEVLAKVAEPVCIVIEPQAAAKAIGSKGGKSKSSAKQAAARSNGKKGGKPKRLG